KEEENGRLHPVLIEYRPSWPRALLRHSALARYVVFNLGSTRPLVNNFVQWLYWLGIRPPHPISEAHAPPPVVGNTGSDPDPQRLELSKRATLWVLDRLPESVGLPPSHIMFLIDGYRVYGPAEIEAARHSFFGIMREYLIAEASRRGYEVQDMQDWF